MSFDDICYIYQAALYCDSCGSEIKERLKAEGKRPKDWQDEDSYNSDEYPKGIVIDQAGFTETEYCEGCGDVIYEVEEDDGTSNFDDDDDDDGERAYPYQIAFQKEDGGFDVVAEFTAGGDEEANREAERRYPDQDWYVLYDGKNINSEGY